MCTHMHMWDLNRVSSCPGPLPRALQFIGILGIPACTQHISGPLNQESELKFGCVASSIAVQYSTNCTTDTGLNNFLKVLLIYFMRERKGQRFSEKEKHPQHAFMLHSFPQAFANHPGSWTCACIARIAGWPGMDRSTQEHGLQHRRISHHHCTTVAGP